MEKNFVFAPASLGRDLHKEGERLAQLTKRKGELAELAFILKAASLGLIVSKPYGDSFLYDMIVESGGGLRKIQIKSSFHSNGPGHSVSLVREKDKDRLTPWYAEGDIDFLAVYVVRHDAWYIIPVQAIKGMKSLRLYPIPPKKKNGGRYEIYREAWHLISAAREPPTPPGKLPAEQRPPEAQSRDDPE